MKALVIPDAHLKPWMFQRTTELMKETGADRAVCLMDIADDWCQQFNLDLYVQTYAERCKHLNLAANVCGYTPVSLGKLIKDGILSDISSIHRETIDRATERKKLRKEVSSSEDVFYQ